MVDVLNDQAVRVCWGAIIERGDRITSLKTVVASPRRPYWAFDRIELPTERFIFQRVGRFRGFCSDDRLLLEGIKERICRDELMLVDNGIRNVVAKVEPSVGMLCAIVRHRPAAYFLRSQYYGIDATGWDKIREAVLTALMMDPVSSHKMLRAVLVHLEHFRNPEWRETALQFARSAPCPHQELVVSLFDEIPPVIPPTRQLEASTEPDDDFDS